MSESSALSVFSFLWDHFISDACKMKVEDIQLSRVVDPQFAVLWQFILADTCSLNFVFLRKRVHTSWLIELPPVVIVDV